MQNGDGDDDDSYLTPYIKINSQQIKDKKKDLGTASAGKTHT